MSVTRFSRALYGLGRVALAVTAGLGAACLVLLLVGAATGERPLVFRSGSMSPGIPTGALGFARTVPARDIHVGDVVTVRTVGGTRVTHRVVELTRHGDVTTLRLKGDANKSPDEALYPVREAPRLSFSVPRAGYVVAWLSHAPGSYLLALYVALMLLLASRRPRDEEPRPGEPSKLLDDRESSAPVRNESFGIAIRRLGAVPGLLAAAVLVAAVGGWGGSTWAAWNDTAVVSGATLATGSFSLPPSAPQASCPQQTVNHQVSFSWAQVNGASSYKVYFPATSGTLTTTNELSFTITTTKSLSGSGTFYVTAINTAGESGPSQKFTYNLGTGSTPGSCSVS